MQDTTRPPATTAKLLKGILPINRAAALRDALAGISLASMDIPQVLGYARIAGMPAVTGLYTAFLPLLAFALFGASRHLVVAADSATATIFASRLSSMAAAGSPEYVALAGYMRLLSPGFVQKWAGRMINIHPSLLPDYKGLDTHQRVLDAGEAKHGCTVHIVTEALDDGAIIAQAEVPVLPGDDADTLARRVLAEEHKLYPAALAKLVRG